MAAVDKIYLTPRDAVKYYEWLITTKTLKFKEDYLAQIHGYLCGVCRQETFLDDLKKYAEGAEETKYVAVANMNFGFYSQLKEKCPIVAVVDEIDDRTRGAWKNFVRRPLRPKKNHKYTVCDERYFHGRSFKQLKSALNYCEKHDLFRTIYYSLRYKYASTSEWLDVVEKRSKK
jgi:hypothetical protein